MRFDQPALEATLADYLQEVEHAAERIIRLEQCIEEAVAQAAPEDPRGDRSFAGLARSGADDRGDGGLRNWAV